MRHGVLILNRSAGRPTAEELIGSICDSIFREGLVVDVVATTCPGDATRIAREAAAEGADIVFALGGDGTIREAAEGLLGTDVPLGPLPGGTANVLTLALGLPRDPLQVAPALCRLEPRPIQVGMAGERCFLMMASAGLDAYVLAHLDPAMKRRFGKAGIALSGLGAWWSYDYPGIEVEADGAVHRASFAAVTNIPLYGGSFRLTPDARCEDESFQLLLFAGTGRSQTLSFALSVLAGSHLERDDVEVLTVDRVRFAGPPAATIQLDGDATAQKPPLDIRLSPRTLRILAPLSD